VVLVLFKEVKSKWDDTREKWTVVGERLGHCSGFALKDFPEAIVTAGHCLQAYEVTEKLLSIAVSAWVVPWEGVRRVPVDDHLSLGYYLDIIGTGTAIPVQGFSTLNSTAITTCLQKASSRSPVEIGDICKDDIALLYLGPAINGLQLGEPLHAMPAAPIPGMTVSIPADQQERRGLMLGNPRFGAHRGNPWPQYSTWGKIITDPSWQGRLKMAQGHVRKGMSGGPVVAKLAPRALQDGHGISLCLNICICLRIL
jgi:hypothetical protein